MPIVARSRGERLEMEYEGAVIYYHRLAIKQNKALMALHTERGYTKNGDVWHEAAKMAVDGWNDQVLSADLVPIPVPHSSDPQEQREQIAAIVEAFPPDLLYVLGENALKETPDFLQQRLPGKSNGSSSSWIAAVDASLRASTADANAQTTDSPSPATPEGSTPAPIG